MRHTFKLFVVLLALLCLVRGAQAQGRRFVTIDVPGFNPYNAPLGINNLGDIAGFYLDTNFQSHGFVRIRGKFQTIDFPGALGSGCGAITDLGLVSGTYFDVMGFQHGFTWQKGQFRQYDVPFATQTQGIPFELGPGLGTAAFGVNLFGNVVGQYADAAGTSRGWVFANGHYYTVDAPGAGVGPGLGTLVFSINLFGGMVGSYHTATAPYVHGWASLGGFFVPINMPGAGGTFGTQANGLNDLGDIFGVYTDAQDHYHGMIVHNGHYSSVDYPGGFDTECHTSNDFGDVIGLYYDANGIAHGFLMTTR